MFICDICNKEYKSLRSLASHKNHHNPDYHYRSKQGALSSQKAATLAAKEVNSNTAKEKHKNKHCLQCNKELSYEKAKQRNKFCNHSCAASYNNALKHTRQKLNNKRKSKNYVSKVVRTCVICSTNFTNRNPVKTCSPECKNELLSQSLKKSFKEGRHKGNEYRSRANPSYMERTFSEWLSKNYPNISFIQEKSFNIYNNGEYIKTFYVDFYFPDLNLAIELDGTHHLSQTEQDEQRDYLLSNQYSTRIVRISHKEYRNKTKVDFIRSLLE